MSLLQPGAADPPSSGLTLTLGSNNPFRNRAAAPALANSSNSQRSPADLPPRPVSRNPFLDASSIDQISQAGFGFGFGSPTKMSSSATDAIQQRKILSSNAAEIFDSLTLDDKPAPANKMRPPPPRSHASEGLPPPYSSSSTQRRENVPPRSQGRRPSRSQEEAMRARRLAAGSTSSTRARPTGELDIFADPPELSSSRTSGDRRPRRNSESSAIGGSSNVLDPEEQKERQERKRRERERRHKERDGKDPKSQKPDRKLDTIDKLDVTSIYGTGLFHHDGPFDACNPHRNRHGSKRAPMQAFPKDSLNNAIGGGGPLNKRPDHAVFLGNNNDEAFKDYSRGGAGYSGLEPHSNGSTRPSTSRQVSNIVSATSRVEPIHGEETLGLGTSTFLEGAPASRTAMQRRESEQVTPIEGSLGRRKSLAQKIRGINSGRRDYGPSGRITSPEGVYGQISHEAAPPGGTKAETNPFFNEFSNEDEAVTLKKEAGLTIVEPPKPGRDRAPSSPGARFGGVPLERRLTAESNSEGPAKGGNGFLARVKSLKGSRKPKIDRPFDE